jgi:CheY-like chemotaxis protein
MRRTTVLVVEDDRATSRLLNAALTDEGYAVELAVDGEALDVACRRQPAVVLLDLQMPGMDGAEVSRRLRRDPATANIPIVLMSDSDHLQMTASRLPVNDRLAKPFDLDRLYAIIAKWETITTSARIAWRVSEERSYAFDRLTRRVVATCFADYLGEWWVIIRGKAWPHGPFKTAPEARQEAARHLQDLGA